VARFAPAQKSRRHNRSCAWQRKTYPVEYIWYSPKLFNFYHISLISQYKRLLLSLEPGLMCFGVHYSPVVEQLWVSVAFLLLPLLHWLDGFFLRKRAINLNALLGYADLQIRTWGPSTDKTFGPLLYFKLVEIKAN